MRFYSLQFNDENEKLNRFDLLRQYFDHASEPRIRKKKMASQATHHCFVTKSKEGLVLAVSKDGSIVQIDENLEKKKYFDQPNNQISPISISFNCDGSKFFVAQQKQVTIFSSKGKQEKQMNTPDISDIKWSPYSPYVLAILTNNMNEIRIFDVRRKDDQPNSFSHKNNTQNQSITAFCWGDESNIWLKYSIVYFVQTSSSDLAKAYLIRPALPKQYQFTIREYTTLSSNLSVDADVLFQNLTESSGRFRKLNDDNLNIRTEIRLPSQIKNINFVALMGSKLICASSTAVYVCVIREVDDCIKKYQSPDILSFVSKVTVFTAFDYFNSLFQVEKIPRINDETSSDEQKADSNQKKSTIIITNSYVSHGIFFNDNNYLFRLFVDEKKIIPLAQINEIKGSCGNILLLKNDNVFKIGEFPESILINDFNSLDLNSQKQYIENISFDKIKEKLQQALYEHNQLCARIRLIEDNIKTLSVEYDDSNQNDVMTERLIRLRERSDEINRKLNELREITKRMKPQCNQQ